MRKFLGVVEAHERAILSRREIAPGLFPLLINKFGGNLLEMLFVRDGAKLLLPALSAGFL